MFTILCLLILCRNREYPGNFQNKTVISKSAQVKWEGKPFWSGQEAYIYPLNYLLPTYRGNVMGERRGTTLQDYHLTDIRDEKVSHFVKFEIILPLLCFLLDPLTNKHCRTWSSMINLWIDSRTCKEFYCQQGQGLIIIT